MTFAVVDDTTLYRTNTSGAFWFVAPIHLPGGSIITDIQYQLCDTNPVSDNTADVFAGVWTKGSDGTFAYLNFDDMTAGNPPPGCALFTKTYSTPIQVNNNSTLYGIEVRLSAPDATNELIGARVGYKLQISPDPSTATFADVPVGHPFHRFVEALVAAGITGGCGAGNYCPDAPVTRGQMAVFLAGALGLHWAP